MAKQRYGINDGYRGSVGTVIGYQWRGKWCLRAKPRFVHNPRTERQQRNRELFKATVQLAGAMKEALHVGFRARSLEEHMTECNRFLRVNKGCFTLMDGALEVDYEHLVLSEGALAGVEFGELGCRDNLLTLPFHRIAEEPCGAGDDRVYLYAWCPERSEGRLSTPAYRSHQQVSIALPEAWAGCEVQLFGFVADLKGNASQSVYIGMLEQPTEDNSHRSVEKNLWHGSCRSDNCSTFASRKEREHSCGADFSVRNNTQWKPT